MINQLSFAKCLIYYQGLSLHKYPGDTAINDHKVRTQTLRPGIQCGKQLE
jgi:hypothetical protein